MILQGSLETSNVNTTEELVNLIESQRVYEMNSKVISAVDQMLSFVNQQLLSVSEVVMKKSIVLALVAVMLSGCAANKYVSDDAARHRANNNQISLQITDKRMPLTIHCIRSKTKMHI